MRPDDALSLAKHCLKEFLVEMVGVGMCHVDDVQDVGKFFYALVVVEARLVGNVHADAGRLGAEHHAAAVELDDLDFVTRRTRTAKELEELGTLVMQPLLVGGIEGVDLNLRGRR